MSKTDQEFRWRAFRTGLLRSAGFPFQWLDDLASEVLERHTARLVDAHERKNIERAETLRALWDLRGHTRSEDMPSLNRAIRRVRADRTVTDSPANISAATTKWNSVAADFDALCDSLGVELDALLAAEYEREVGLLLNHVVADYFKDGVLLSSPLSYEACCRAAEDKGFRRSKDELAAYRFLQRFSGKNETGGAIGPVNLILMGGAENSVDSDGVQHADDSVLGRIEYTADGDGRSAQRRTFLSYWAACEIGASLIRNSVDARLPYRKLGVPHLELSEVDEQVLVRVDGHRSISALAAELALPVDTVDASVSRLAGLDLVADTWRVPDFTTDPGEDLRDLAARIDTPDAAAARKLVADVRRFARTPFEGRPALLSTITRDFSRLTDKPAWRGAGQLRADRAVLYEEATGNIRGARIGSAGAERMTDRLSTAMEFLASVAIEQRVAGQDLLARELARRGVSELPAAEVRAMATGGPPPGQATLQERFLRLVDLSAPAVELSRDDLVAAGLIRTDLDDWPVFGAADLMLTGPGGGPGGDAGGDTDGGPGSIVLSELHHIWPTLGCWVRALYDDGDLANEELWHIVSGELAPAVPTLQEIVRHEKGTDSSPHGHTVLCLDNDSPIPGAVTVPADRAVVRRWQNGFIGLHDPADRRDLWLLPEYDDSGVHVGGLMNCAIPALSQKVFTFGSHTPRIVIDGVVIQRRRWQIEVAEVPGGGGSRVPTEREWLALQLWRRGLGLPRRVYFLPDTEGKPVYLDFSSVLSATNFLRCLRSARRVVLTEALPDPERLWLRTKDGALTSEIRVLLWRDRRTASSSSG